MIWKCHCEAEKKIPGQPMEFQVFQDALIIDIFQKQNLAVKNKINLC